METEMNMIEEYLKDINQELVKYIKNNIFPSYEKFYSHGLAHIANVLKNVMYMADVYKLDKNMCFTMVAYHDLGLAVDRENHEKESGKIVMKDQNLRNFFNEEQLQIIKEAIEDHRGSRKERPRNIYGEILSDSDRDFDIKFLAKRQLATSIKNYPEIDTPEGHFERCYNYLLKRLNEGGHFNLWTNHSYFIEAREKFEKDFFDKDYARSVYIVEFNKIASDGTIDKIKSYYQDY